MAETICVKFIETIWNRIYSIAAQLAILAIVSIHRLSEHEVGWKKNNYENALDIVSWMVCDKHVAWLLVILWLLTFAASYFEERHHTAP